MIIDNMLRYFPWRVLVVALVLLGMTVSRPSCLGQGVEIKVSEFTCSNQLFSEAISLLSKEASLRINCIVDGLEEPTVSISESNSTVGIILGHILSFAPKYRFISRNGVILVLPEGMEKNPSFPLNRIQSKFDINYKAYTNLNGAVVYYCDFSQPGHQYPANVAMPALFFKNKPTDLSIPHVATFTNQSLADALNAVSVKTRTSWSCGRVRPDYILWFNNDLRAKSEIGSTWWQDEKAPGYWIAWGKGAFHGEYAYVTTTTDAQGILHQKKVTLEEIAQKEAKEQESKRRWDYFKTINKRLVQGSTNNSPRSVGFQMGIDATEVSNRTTAVLLSLTITNTSADEVRIPNPYLGDLQEAFWDIRVDNFKYQIELPSTPTAPEPKELVLAPHSAMTRAIDILGVKMLLDEKYTGPDFHGETATKLRSPGKYLLAAWLYFKGPDGNEHAILSQEEFEIK